MPEYRVYFIDKGAHISRPPELIECANDEEAIQRARQFIDGKDVELWKGGSLITRLPHEPKK